MNKLLIFCVQKSHHKTHQEEWGCHRKVLLRTKHRGSWLCDLVTLNLLWIPWKIPWIPWRILCWRALILAAKEPWLWRALCSQCLYEVMRIQRCLNMALCSSLLWATSWTRQVLSQYILHGVSESMCGFEAFTGRKICYQRAFMVS